VFYTRLKAPKLVHEYFERTGKNSVVEWWNPEQGDRASLLNQQIKLVINWINDLINQSKQYRILEIGVGKGRVASVLWKSLKPAVKSKINYYGQDINKIMLKKAKTRFKQEKIPILLFQGKADTLPFGDSFFDIVICLETVVHLPLMKETLKEWKRVSKSGGVIISDVDNLFSFRRLLKSLFLYLSKLLGSKVEPKGNGIFKAHTLKEYKNLLSNAGFQIKKFYHLGFFTPIDISIAAFSFKPKNIYVIPPWLAKHLQKLNKFIENIYPFAYFSEYFISLVVKTP